MTVEIHRPELEALIIERMNRRFRPIPTPAFRLFRRPPTGLPSR
jgi:hypothetical protein